MAIYRLFVLVTDKWLSGGVSMLGTLERFAYTTRLVLSASSNSGGLLPDTPRPFGVSVNLTENCQARCRTCNYWHERKDEPISVTRAKRLIDEFVEHGFRYLRWAGGEPLMRRDFFEVLAHIPKGAFAKITLGTNGLLLQRFIHDINDSCLTNISVSLDGFGQTHRMLRGVDFDKVRDALTKVRGKRIKIASLFTKHLVKDIDLMLTWCDDEGYDFEIVLPSKVLPYSNTEEINRNITEMWPSQEGVDRVLAALLRKRGTITASLAEGARAYMLEGRYTFRHCMNGYTEIRITANGNVYPSCFEMGELGNILREPLSDILSKQRTARIARRMYDLDCSRCLLGWQASGVFEYPWRNLPYVYKRLRTQCSTASRTRSSLVAPHEHSR